MIEQAFEVAAEFKFDVGQALISTKALQGAVDDVSASANTAMTSLNYLASGLVAHLGFGSGGLLTVLSRAVQISEAFNQSALGFANNISSNIQVLAGDITTFNDRLNTSKTIMGDISDTAIKFGIDRNHLASLTQLVASPLAARGKLGTNYSGGIGMAKNMMIASEAVGLPGGAGGEQLARALSPGQAVGGKLFERLMQTPAFRQAHVIHPQQLATMNQDKKIDLLSKALETLGGDAEFLNARLDQFSVQLEMLKMNIEALLRPIGDSIIKPIKTIIKGINIYLQQHGKEIGDNIGKLIGNVFEDPQKLFVGLMQMKNFGHDFKKALHLTEIIQTLIFLKWGLGKLGIALNGGLMRQGLTFLIDGLATLAGWIWRAGIIGRIFSLIRMAILEVLPIFASLLFFFQILSRAKAIAKLEDIKAMVGFIPRISAVLVKLKSALELILMPINMAIDFWAKLIAPLFESSTWVGILLPVLESFADVLQGLGMAVYYTLAGISGLSYALIGFVDDLMHLKNPFANLVDNFKTGFQDFLTGHPLGQNPDKAVVNQVTNIGKIEARFDMREQMEPDRIAFAVSTHLKKLSQNPTQGRGGSLSGALSGANGIAGAR